MKTSMTDSRQWWDIGGVSTCVYDSSVSDEGPVVIFVHGGDPRSLSNALDWSTVWRPALVGGRLIAYDKPGQGLTYGSTMPEEVMGAAGLTDHLERMVEMIAVPSVVLVGHSRGALPVAATALRRPDVVSGVVLVSSNTLALASTETPSNFYRTALGDPPAEPTVEYVRREPGMNSFTDGHVDEVLVRARMGNALSNNWWHDRERRELIYARTVLPELRSLRRQVMETIDREGFAAPVLQIWGQQDVSSPVSLATELFASISAQTDDAWSLVVNRAAHYVYRDQPGAFIRALNAFLGFVEKRREPVRTPGA